MINLTNPFTAIILHKITDGSMRTSSIHAKRSETRIWN